MKYKIGQRIKFIGYQIIYSSARQDIGKTGTIVGFTKVGVLIFLPSSTHVSKFSIKERPVSWETEEVCIELLKDQQLLFPFME